MTLRIGTRGSPLALAQAHELRARLMAAHGFAQSDFELRIIKTSGDAVQDRPLAEIGGKGLFTKEIEEALLAGDIDMAVHSMKDVATVLPDGLAIACLLEREDVADAFISLKAKRLADLAAGAIVGTSSLRRQAQIKRVRPDIKVITYRGNVQTRLRKLREGVADATLLACAGLKRLGMADQITAVIGVDEMLPAVAQGAIGVEIGDGNERVRDILRPLNHAQTALCIAAERAFLARLDGSCRTPIAGLAVLKHGELHFRGQILLPDGSESFEAARTGPPSEAIVIGEDAAGELIDRAGPAFMKALA